MDSSNTQLITVSEAALVLGLGKRIVDRMIAEGVLPAIKFRKAIRIDRCDIAALIETRRVRRGVAA